MNIFDNTSTDKLFIRPFLIPDPNSRFSEFIEVNVYKIFGTDPEFTQFSAFESGYNISFTLTSCTDLRYLADRNLLVEVILSPSVGQPIQVGSEEGFELVGITPPPSPDKTLYVYTFKTNKPNNKPFKERIYD